MENTKKLFLSKNEINIYRQLNNDSETTKKNLKRKFLLEKIIGKSLSITSVRQKIEKISTCDVNVLISGESGTGKELAARAIHYLSSRAGKPFVPVNCGAIPESLFENELFGHIKGAFTDANYTQKGLVEEANGGTLFLDEISSLSSYIQAKLLRLLQDKEFKPLGDPRPRTADIRIIAATNKPIMQLIEEEKFRDDLYYRLDIVSVHIPPLRERKEDIQILVNHFINNYSKKYGNPVTKITNEALEILISYQWPGNVRELENKIQHIIVMLTSSVIEKNNIPISLYMQKTETHKIEKLRPLKKKIVDAFEKDYLVRLLTKYKGDMVVAAEKAGKSRTSLWNLLKKYDLSPKQFRT